MDNTGMRRLVVETPDQLATARSLVVPDLEPADVVVLTGMGGSAMAARAAATVISNQGAVAVVHSGYGLPPWAVERKATVVACSYSGNTEETLDAVATAVAAGLQVAAVTSGGVLGGLSGVGVVTVSGGIQPRAAVGHQAGALVRVLAALGLAPGWEAAVDETVSVLRRLIDDGSGAGAALGADIGDAMVHAIPIIVGSGESAAPAATRWATQLNENAKRLAFPVELPEMNHNLLEAMAAAGHEPGTVGVVALRDPGDHARHAVRIDHTLARLGGKVQSLGEVRAQGTCALARFFSLAIVGDFASVALADQLGIDATNVAVLEDFKRAIARREDET